MGWKGMEGEGWRPPVLRGFQLRRVVFGEVSGSRNEWKQTQASRHPVEVPNGGYARSVRYSQEGS